VQILKTEALVLKRTDFSNTSQILDLFTLDRGRVPVLAKGARHYRKRVHRLIDLLYHGQAIILEKPTREVQILGDFETIDHFPGLRRHLDRFHAGLHVLHLLRRVTQPEAAEPRLFSLAVRGLTRFQSAPLERMPAETIAFDQRFLSVIGFRLVLACCPRCGVTHRERDATAFQPVAGGAVCDRCRSSGVGPSLPMSAAGRGLLRELAQRTGADRDRVRLVSSVVLEVRKILNAALTSWLEAELPMLKYLVPQPQGRPAGRP